MHFFGYHFLDHLVVKYCLVIIFFATFTLTYGQEKQVIPGKAFFEFDQVYGLDSDEGEYLLTTIYTSDTLKWRTSDALPMEICAIIKKTEEYIVALSEDGTHVFYAITDKRLFYLIEEQTRFIAYGIGEGSLALRETVTQMIDVLDNGGVETDVIDFLIKQAEYDF